MKWYKKLVDGIPSGGLIAEDNFRQAFPELFSGNRGIAEVISAGYCEFIRVTPPMNRDFLLEYTEGTPTEIEPGIWNQQWELTSVVFADQAAEDKALLNTNFMYLCEKQAELKAHFINASLRPRVSTGLGFDVDGGRSDLVNLQIGQELGLLEVRDADDVVQTITLEDYPTILLAIKAKWIAFMQAKWSVKDNLNSISLTTSTARAEMDLVDLTTDLDAS